MSRVMAALLVGGLPSSGWLDNGWTRLLMVRTELRVVLSGTGWWHRRCTLLRLDGRPGRRPGRGRIRGGLGVGPGQGMRGRDGGGPSVSVLMDEERLHVAGPVRPGQRVTVYTGSDSATPITALDGGFEAVTARTCNSSEPAQIGDHHVVSQPACSPDGGSAGTLSVRADLWWSPVSSLVPAGAPGGRRSNVARRSPADLPRGRWRLPASEGRDPSVTAVATDHQ